MTVTHHEMTSYFMTIPEAAQLVFPASPPARGRFSVLDMGEPVRIVDPARNLIFSPACSGPRYQAAIYGPVSGREYVSRN